MTAHKLRVKVKRKANTFIKLKLDLNLVYFLLIFVDITIIVGLVKFGFIRHVSSQGHDLISIHVCFHLSYNYSCPLSTILYIYKLS